MSIEVQQEITGAASQNSWTQGSSGGFRVALECRLDAKLRCAPPTAGVRGLGARAALLQMQHEPMRTGQRTAEQAAAAPGAKSRNQVGNTLMQGAGRAHAASTTVGVKLLGVAMRAVGAVSAASPRPPRATRRTGSQCRATAWRATPSAASSPSMSPSSTWAKTRYSWASCWRDEVADEACRCAGAAARGCAYQK